MIQSYTKEKKENPNCSNKNEDPCVFFEMDKNLLTPRINSLKAIEREIEYAYEDLRNLPSKVLQVVRYSKETASAAQEKAAKRLNYGIRDKMFDNLCSMEVDHSLWEELRTQFVADYKKSMPMPRERDWEPKLEDYQKQEFIGLKPLPMPLSPSATTSKGIKRGSKAPILSSDFTLMEDDIFFAQTANMID